MWTSAWNLSTYILGNCQWCVIKLCGIRIISLTNLLCGISFNYITVDFALNVSLNLWNNLIIIENCFYPLMFPITFYVSWDSLEHRRRIPRLVMFFKAIQGLIRLIMSGVLNNYDYRWMLMLDLIYMGSADLFGTRRERKIIMKICFQLDSNPRHATPRQESLRFRLLSHAW